MKKTLFLTAFIAAVSFALVSCDCAKKEKPIGDVVTQSLDFCAQQYKLMAQSLKNEDGKLPRTADWNSKLITCDSHWWTSGHFPGSLWYLYEYTGDQEMKSMAELYTRRIEDQQFTTDNHDVGFIIWCSVGNEYRLTGASDKRLEEIIVNTANSLATRFNPAVGCTQSWNTGADHPRGWRFPVIIDNMMNLELLEEAAAISGDSKYSDMARTHANTTLKNHFRADNSSYHVIDYDPETGEAVHKHTAQGYADESAWARGQAWGLYGYTMMYRKTQDPAYLDQAMKIADFMISHPDMPQDMIPYWDFDAPNPPDAYRDVAAATIMCSALIELSGYAGDGKGPEYLAVAEKQLRSLAEPFYRAEPGKNANFILKHSVGSLPGKGEVDVPLSYADYYYIEALMRYKKLLSI